MVVLFLLLRLLCPLFIIGFGLGVRSLSTDRDAFFLFSEKGNKENNWPAWREPVESTAQSGMVL